MFENMPVILCDAIAIEKVNFRPRMQLAISNAQAQRPLKMTHIIGQSNIWLLILTKK